jgi:hypothetical protein
MYAKIDAKKLLQHHVLNDLTILCEILKKNNLLGGNRVVRKISEHDYLEYWGHIDGITHCAYIHRDSEHNAHIIDFPDLQGVTDDKHLADMRRIKMEGMDSHRSQLHENQNYIQEQKYCCLFEELGIEYEYKPHHDEVIAEIGYRPSFYLPNMRVFEFQSTVLGIYLDIFNPYEPANQNKCIADITNANNIIMNAFELPSSMSQSPCELDPFQLVSNRYTFMSYFGGYVLAEPHYHGLTQERQFAGECQKDRMEICFEAANKIEERFENSPPADLS